MVLALAFYLLCLAFSPQLPTRPLMVALIVAFGG
jgi:hypothetical protein